MSVPEIEYDIHLSDDGLYVRVTVSGQMTVENAIGLEAAAAEACRKHGVDYVLLDARNAINVSSVRENAGFERNPNRVGVGFPDHFVQSLLVSRTDRSHDLIVTFLRSKGRQIFLFRDEHGAVEFLRREAKGRRRYDSTPLTVRCRFPRDPRGHGGFPVAVGQRSLPTPTPTSPG
jgi:hypothetical protein